MPITDGRVVGINRAHVINNGRSNNNAQGNKCFVCINHLLLKSIICIKKTVYFKIPVKLSRNIVFF